MRALKSLSIEELRAIVRQVQLILWRDTFPADAEGRLLLDEEGYPDWLAESENSADVLNPNADYDEPREYLLGIAQHLGLYGLAPDKVELLDEEPSIVLDEH